MGHALYSHQNLFDLGRENYKKLVSYCHILENGGFWSQARQVMKQSSTQVLDLYVQSVLVSLAVHCGDIVESQREYILAVTDTNPLDIPDSGKISEEIIQYAQKTEKMPPVLIQLCGVYDGHGREHMALHFLDAMFNVFLCMVYMGNGREEAVSRFMQDYYDRISMFVQIPGKNEASGALYVSRKLDAASIGCEVHWLLGQEQESPSVVSEDPESGERKPESQEKEKKRVAAGEGSGRKKKASKEKKSSGKHQKKSKPAEQGAQRQTAGERAGQGEKERQEAREETEQEEKERQEAEKKARQEEKERREAERKARQEQEERRRAEEKARQEREAQQAREEFQKVKKRLRAKEKAEREAQEKRVAALLQELNELVGLESVKEEIRSLINLIKVRKMREKMNMPSMDMSYHMVFTGSPGTGKTTVARLVARIYKELGILSEGQLVETDRSRLVAGYVGQTAINVREIVEQAIGGVLFIDEAYALVSPDTANDFGSEAVDTLVKLMEDHRDNLVVIVAGYTEEMKVFLKSNTGLISRFNKFIAFADYSQQQLLDILEVMVRQAGLTIEEEALKKVGDKLEGMSREEKTDFGNARGVRNIFEKMVMNQANRLVSIEEPTKELLMTLTGEDAVRV